MHLQKLIFVLQYVCFISGRASKVRVLVQSPKSWQEARNFCQERFHGSLYSNDDTLSVKDFEDVPENEPFWIGNYTTLSAWITNIGCYVRTGNTVNMSETLLESNNPGVCQIICNASTYFAVKGHTCICLVKEISAYFRKSPDTTCNTICSQNTNSFELCGGETAYSIYQQVDLKGKLSKQDGSCVAVKCIGDGVNSYIQYSGRNCSEIHPSICKMQRGSRVLLLDKFRTTNWTEGAKVCFVDNNTTMTTDIDMTCAYGFVQLFNNFFWVGIYRQMVTIIQDWPGGNVEQCTAMMKSQNSKIDTGFYNCSKELPFLCQYTLPGSPKATSEELTTVYSPGVEAVSISNRTSTQDLLTTLLSSAKSEHLQSNMKFLSTESQVTERIISTSKRHTETFSTSDGTSNIPEHFERTVYTYDITTGDSIDKLPRTFNTRTVLPTANTDNNDMAEKITFKTTLQNIPQTSPTITPSAADSTHSPLITMENNDSSTGMIIGIVAAAIVVVLVAVLTVCHCYRCYQRITSSVRRKTIHKRSDESNYQTTTQTPYEDLKNRETPRPYSKLSHQSFSGYMSSHIAMEDSEDYIEMGSENLYDSVKTEKRKDLKTIKLNENMPYNNDYIDVIEIQIQDKSEEKLYTSLH